MEKYDFLKIIFEISDFVLFSHKTLSILMPEIKSIPFNWEMVSLSHNDAFGKALKLRSVSFSNLIQFFIFATVIVACSSSFSFGGGFLAGFMLSNPRRSDKNSSL